MKTFVISILFLLIAVAAPFSASAATNPGVKPGSFFYFFDTAFERVNLFFTFNPEKKARKALEYADERLAEAETLTESKDSNMVQAVMENYTANIALAAEKSKEVKDQQASENLLSTIADNTSKNQEVLNNVLTKVPEEAKDAIAKAIEASKKEQEEAIKQIAQLKGEVEQLKKEVAELKKESNDPQANEVEKLKQEIEELKAKEEVKIKTSEELNKQKSQNISTPIKPKVSPASEIPLKLTSPAPTVVDICKNIEGTQTTMPAGMRWDNNQNCVASEPNVQTTPIVDLCNNIEGAQSYIPSGMTGDGNGNCIVPPTLTPTPIPTPDASAVKAADIENQITSYLQNLESWIMAKNQEINAKIIADSIANSLATKPLTACQGIKTSSGCVIDNKFSVDMGLTVLNSQLSQLLQRKDRLNTIYAKVQNYGNGGALPSAEDISFLASIGISW